MRFRLAESATIDTDSVPIDARETAPASTASSKTEKQVTRVYPSDFTSVRLLLKRNRASKLKRRLKRDRLAAFRTLLSPNDPADELSTSSTHLENTLAQYPLPLPGFPSFGSSNGAPYPEPVASTASRTSLSEAGYDIWDPQNWMLDGLLDFNYTFSQPTQGN